MIALALLGCIYCAQNRMLFSKFNFFSTWSEHILMPKFNFFRLDNGSEFLSSPILKLFHDNGILQELTCVDTPQQNGVVERKHRHILNVARCLRFRAHLPIKFWGECILTAVYLINRTPSHILKNVSPYERLFRRTPNYKYLRVFGCLCYAQSPRVGRDKFQPRSVPCVFLGYPPRHSSYRLFNLDKFSISRDVIFFRIFSPSMFRVLATYHLPQARYLASLTSTLLNPSVL